MNLSEKLKALRTQAGLTLQGLSKKSGVGIATLSRLENGSRKGTLRTHQKICDALNIELVDLFKETETHDDDIETLTPESEEIETFLYNDKASSVILTPNALRKNMLPVLLMLEPQGQTHQEQNSKNTEKFLFCLEGSLEVTIGEKALMLGTNGVLYFKSSLPHQIKNTGSTKARCLCISSPAAI